MTPPGEANSAWNGTGVVLWKTHGARNDFLFTETPPDVLAPRGVQALRDAARSLCHRTASLGADGLVFLRRVGREVEVLVVNSDGSFAGTCGNALRCVGLHAALSGWWDGAAPLPVFRWVPQSFAAGTSREGVGSLGADEQGMATREMFAVLRGLRELAPRSAEIDVDMGAPRSVREVALAPKVRALLAAATASAAEAATAAVTFEDVRAFHVELSNPHLVLVGASLGTLSSSTHERLGRLAQGPEVLSSLPGVPLANVGFLSPSTSMEPAGAGAYHSLVVYERGAGRTQCCGSGATAARLALEAAGIVAHSAAWVPFAMPGGRVSIGRSSGDILTLRGPAVRVARCEHALPFE